MSYISACPIILLKPVTDVKAERTGLKSIAMKTEKYSAYRKPFFFSVLIKDLNIIDS
jgi:hypothetical protein